MQSLCYAMQGKPESRADDMDDFDMERVLTAQAEEQLEKDVVAEIDRYRRMDEWSSSFQNVYSRAALRSQMQLMQANILDVDVMQFLPYTRPGTFNLLRLDAFECLVELGIFNAPELLKWFMFTMASDSSVWLRRSLHGLFGKALAPVAFGHGRKKEAPAPGDGLIIEQESSTEIRQADLARRQTITGALAALKREISGDPVLKESLWAACNSTYTGILEISEFTDLCRILYDPITSVMVKLRYPRYWKAKHLGKVSTGFYKRIRLIILNISRGLYISPGRIGCACVSSHQRKQPQQSANETMECHHQDLASRSSSPNWVRIPRPRTVQQRRSKSQSSVSRSAPLRLNHRRRRRLLRELRLLLGQVVSS